MSYSDWTYTKTLTYVTLKNKSIVCTTDLSAVIRASPTKMLLVFRGGPTVDIVYEDPVDLTEDSITIRAAMLENTRTVKANRE